MAKPNHLLASFEAKIRAEYEVKMAQMEADHKQRIRNISEISLIALLLAAHENLKVGPGRAPGLMAEYLHQKMQIADMLLEDIGGPDKYNKGEWLGDKSFQKTGHDLSVVLRGILGSHWDEYKEFFPMLEDWWGD